MNQDMQALLLPYVVAVEQELRRHVPPTQDPYLPYYGMIHYHLGWLNAQFEPAQGSHGKRIRSALCLLTCEAISGNFQPALPAAASLELLHEFSLVHDDIEDGDRERRHKPTLWVQWGMPQAINAGDTLFALAQLALLRTSDQGVAPEVVLKAQRVFNATALRLCQGQFLDIDFEQRDKVSSDDYMVMIGGKTAALIGLTLTLGGLIGGADDAACQALGQLGEELGLAFQMQDDLLGLWGDPARTGKPVGNDIRRRKKSLPVLIALESNTPAGEQLRALYQRESFSDADVATALALMEETGARTQVQRLAQEHHNRAYAAFDATRIPREQAKPLLALAEALLNRTY